MNAARTVLCPTLVAIAAAVKCSVHQSVYGSDSLRVANVQEVECAEGEYCMREMYFATSGRHGLSQACTSNPWDAGSSRMSIVYEASVGSCCRQSANRIAQDFRVIFYDSDPGVLADDARMAFMEQYDDADDNYSECPCYCKYRPSESSRRRTWWSTRRRPNAGAVAAQAMCPFAADLTDDATTSPTAAPTPTTSSNDAIDVVTTVEITFPGNLSNLNATVQEALKAAVVIAVQEVAEGDATYTVALRAGSIIAVITVTGTAADTAALVSHVDANPIAVAVPGFSARSTSAALATASVPADVPSTTESSGGYAPAQTRVVAVVASISLFATRAGQL